MSWIWLWCSNRFRWMKSLHFLEKYSLQHLISGKSRICFPLHFYSWMFYENNSAGNYIDLVYNKKDDWRYILATILNSPINMKNRNIQVTHKGWDLMTTVRNYLVSHLTFMMPFSWELISFWSKLCSFLSINGNL